MKSILMINPPNCPFTEQSLLIEPIDILTLTMYLKELGYNTNFIDMDLKQMSIEDLKCYITNSFMPDIVIISYDYHIPLHTSETINLMQQMCEELKSLGIKVIIIGKTISYSEEFAKNIYFDVGIMGEVENTLNELLQLEEWNNNNFKNVKGIVYKNNEDIIKNVAREDKINLDELPFVDREIINIDDYINVRSMLTSRGCVNKCDFCPTFNYWGNWRGKTAIRVVDEIEQIINKYNSKKIVFLDDNATVDKQRMNDISNLIIHRKIDIKLGLLSSINMFDEEIFTNMFRAGFRWVHFGIETGSQRVLENNNKYFNIDYAKKAVLKAKSIGYRVRTSFIFDLPTTEKEDMKKTIDFILGTEPDEVRGHFLALRLGTKIYDKSNVSGKLTSQYIHKNKPEFESHNYSKEELTKDVEMLEKMLKERDYCIVKDVSIWRNTEQLRNKNGEIKFLSFCPSRYGIDWEKFENKNLKISIKN